jgi:predicted ATPase
MHLNRITLHADRYPTAEHYPFNLPLLRTTPHLDFTTPVTCFVGENGTGKSTLLEAITLRCGIHIWREERVRLQHNPFEGKLADYLTAEWTNGSVPGSFFGSSIFGQFASLLDEWARSDPGQLKYLGGKSLVTQSHGQSLMSFFRARYQIKGLYLLDEPETALSPRTQLELLGLLAEMSRAGHAQFIIATHSPILLACPDATLYSFDQAPIAPVRYEDTEHYRVYRDFLGGREHYLRGIGG